ncbi:MAG: hypothetical protein NT027_03840, partial [Proteobacteria bacterium]|nr:hypothetical protein [Pseudomonadota bacterium]
KIPPTVPANKIENSSESESSLLTTEQNVVKICEQNQNNASTIAPKHQSMLDRAEDFSDALGFYCAQRKDLMAKNCVFSGNSSALCAQVGKGRPQWITETCEVSEEGMHRSIQTLAYEGCSIIASAATTGTNAGSCDWPIIQGICYAHYNGARDFYKFFNQTDNSLKAEDLARDRMIATFRSGVVRCLGSLAKDHLLRAMQDSTVNASSLIQRAARFTLGKAALDTFKDPNVWTKPDLLGPGSTSSKAAVGKSMLKYGAVALCSATARSLAASIDKAPPNNYQNACGPRTPVEQQSRSASCLRTTADACETYIGMVDFNGIYETYSGQTSGYALRQSLMTAGIVTDEVCGLGGRASNIACGAISSATKQILKSINEGNNDWADCLGTAKAGACVGEKYAEYIGGISVASMDAPIVQPMVENGVTTRMCCQCQKVYYSDGWTGDVKFRRDSILQGVTSYVASGTDQTSCTYFEKGRNDIPGVTRKGKDVYFQLESCRQVILVDAPSCQSQAYSYGQFMPRESYKGAPVTGPQSTFGEERIHFGTLECLDGDC